MQLKKLQVVFWKIWVGDDVLNVVKAANLTEGTLIEFRGIDSHDRLL